MIKPNFAIPPYLTNTMQCDICGIEDRRGKFPAALVLKGRVVCHECLPSDINQAITAIFYRKCKEETCENWLFELEEAHSLYCNRCQYEIFFYGKPKKREISND